MKYFIVSCILLASGVFAQDDGCAMCEYGIKIFFSHLTSDYGMRFQVAILSKDVCPTFEHPFQCDRGVGLHWSGINHVIYNEGAAHFSCNSITGSNCTKPNPDGYNTQLFDPKAWTCDDCMREVALIATQYSLPHVTQHFVRLLSHEDYCADPVLGLSQHEIDVCSEYVHAFMGPAFRGLDAAYVGNAQAICHYWYDGVCHEPRNSKMFPMK